MSPEQRAELLAVLHEPRFADAAPAGVYAQLLDEGRYLWAERTLYWVLAEKLGLLTSHDVHHGLADARLEARATVLAAAFAAHPERFSHGPPKPQALPNAVWINNPERLANSDQAVQSSHESTVSFALTGSAG